MLIEIIAELGPANYHIYQQMKIIVLDRASSLYLNKGRPTR